MTENLSKYSSNTSSSKYYAHVILFSEKRKEEALARFQIQTSYIYK